MTNVSSLYEQTVVFLVWYLTWVDSHKIFQLMHKINEIINPSIFPSIALITISISNLYTILYSSAAKTLCITCLHLIKN